MSVRLPSSLGMDPVSLFLCNTMSRIEMRRRSSSTTQSIAKAVGTLFTPGQVLAMLRVLQAATLSFLALALISMLMMYLLFSQCSPIQNQAQIRFCCSQGRGARVPAIQMILGTASPVDSAAACPSQYHHPLPRQPAELPGVRPTWQQSVPLRHSSQDAKMQCMVGSLGVGRSASSDIIVTSSFDTSSVVRSGIVLTLPVVGPAYMFDGSSVSFKLSLCTRCQ